MEVGNLPYTSPGQPMGEGQGFIRGPALRPHAGYGPGILQEYSTVHVILLMSILIQYCNVLVM